ncbi:unnamed protein product, partial [Pylaiella littoralis]
LRVTNANTAVVRYLRTEPGRVFVYCVCSRVFSLRDRFGVPRKGICEVAYAGATLLLVSSLQPC